MQEGRASRALQALTRTIPAMAIVRRDGETLRIPARELALGDIVLLQEGDHVPTDGRIISENGLRIDESMLTGESLPVGKTSKALDLPPNAPLGDIRNAALGQTLVVSGSGEMVVTVIGTETEFGQIADTLRHGQTAPPLTHAIAHLSRTIAIVIAVFSIFLFFVGYFVGNPPATLLLTIMSLVVSIVPEGLPIVLTLVLANGVTRMARKHAVIKKLNAVEGLGQVDIICTDKTGTLTHNQLNAVAAATPESTIDVTGEGYDPRGTISAERGAPDEENMHRLALAAHLIGQGALGKDADGTWKPLRDPVEAAMRCLSLRYGLPNNVHERLEAQPFSYTEKIQSARWQVNGEAVSFMAGSPEAVLKHTEATAHVRQWLDTTIALYASKGLRVIAFAERDGSLPLHVQTSWRLLGIIAMGDTLRERVVESVLWCRKQNIRVVMITGDHPQTALAIAQEAGIADELSEVLNGSELTTMSDEDLASRLDGIRVFSRIAPSDKLRIVNAYRTKGLITAMTGDGVNDAPALNQADIGIAMGKSGTDVAREAAHLVLMDDNFATIIDAIQQGRTTIGNLRRVLMYLFTTGLADVIVLTITIIFALPLPLLAGQIIWINLVTDSFLDISLGMEPGHGSPRKGRSLVDRSSLTRMVILGCVMAAGTLAVYAKYLSETPEMMHTMTLTTLAVYQWVNAWSARSETLSITRLPLLGNPALIAATSTVIFLQLLAVYTPPFQRVLHTTALGLADWGIAIAVASTVLLVDEIWKRAKHRPEAQLSVLR